MGCELRRCTRRRKQTPKVRIESPCGATEGERGGAPLELGKGPCTAPTFLQLSDTLRFFKMQLIFGNSTSP